jgi:hypothetical protein
VALLDTPDIFTLAKAQTGGYLEVTGAPPITAASPKVDSFEIIRFLFNHVDFLLCPD